MHLLVEGRAVKDAVLNVHPDKVGLGRGHHLCDKNTGDALGDTQQRLLGILLGLTESFPQVGGVRQDGSAVLGHGVQLSLLGERLVGHGEGWCVLLGG